MKTKFLILIFSFFTFLSCKKDEPTISQPSGRSYAGLKLYSKLEYAVEKIVFTEFSPDSTIKLEFIIDTTATDTLLRYISGVDTLNFYIKDSIVEKIIDLEDDSAFVIHRFYSLGSERQYSKYPDSVWTAKFKHNQYLRTENNIQYAKLSFSVSKNKTWDINAHNYLDYDEVTYTKIRYPKTINTNYFDDVIEVEQENNYDSSALRSILHLYSVNSNPFTDIDIVKEEYANEIGLINRVNIHLKNFDSQDSISGLNNEYYEIQNGFIEYQRIVDFR